MLTSIKSANNFSFSPANADSVEEATDKLVALAHKQREIVPAVALHNLPVFNRIMRLGGRCYIGSDLLALALAYVIGQVITLLSLNNLEDLSTGNLTGITFVGGLQQFMVFIIPGVMALLWLDTKGHYRQRLPYWETLNHFTTITFVGLICGGFVQYALKDGFSRIQLASSWLMFGVLLFLGRTTVRHMLNKRGLWQINTLIIGTKATAAEIIKAITREKQMGYAVVGNISSESLFHLRKSNAWKQLFTLYEANHAFIALEGSEIENHPATIKAMVRSRVPYSLVPPWLGLPSSSLSPHSFMMRDVLVLHNTNRLRMLLPRLIKRSFDILAAGSALIILSPVLMAIAIIVRRDGGPAFFKQSRVGFHGKHFKCYKFRSMRTDAEDVLKIYLAQNADAAEEWKNFQKLKNDVRVTRFGKFIRKSSMDELPQLLNVLKGDMSLVGPRPIMPGQEVFYADDFTYYESVRPGITGPWQVSGRNHLTFKERVSLESWYARNWNFWMDIVILLKTFPSVLKGDQAY